MGIYYLYTKIISRSKVKSSVGASTYRSGEKFYNERYGLEHDYRREKWVVYKEVLLPKNAPNWVTNREKLWNEVYEIERVKTVNLQYKME